MRVADIRQKLQEYIQVADGRKLKVIYQMLEEDMTRPTDWWKDAAFVNELNKEYAQWKQGKTKDYTMDDIESDIVQLKAGQQIK